MVISFFRELENQTWAGMVFPDENSNMPMGILLINVLKSMEFCFEAAVKLSTDTLSTYSSYIASIPNLTNNNATQLAVDIFYLGDILDDLGSPLTGNLTSTAVLLRVQPESWNVECSGHSSKVVAMVNQLMNILPVIS